MSAHGAQLDDPESSPIPRSLPQAHLQSPFCHCKVTRHGFQGSRQGMRVGEGERGLHPLKLHPAPVTSPGAQTETRSSDRTEPEVSGGVRSCLSRWPEALAPTRPPPSWVPACENAEAPLSQGSGSGWFARRSLGGPRWASGLNALELCRIWILTGGSSPRRLWPRPVAVFQRT